MTLVQQFKSSGEGETQLREAFNVFADKDPVTQKATEFISAGNLKHVSIKFHYMKAGKMVDLIHVGWREWIVLPNHDNFLIKAKIDTGARSSALDATHIEEYHKNNQKWIKHANVYIDICIYIYILMNINICICTHIYI